MSTNEDIWPDEFERIGERAIRNSLALGRAAEVGLNSEAKRQAALRWLREKDQGRERRDAQTHWHAKWAFRAAVGALVMSCLAFLMTIVLALKG